MRTLAGLTILTMSTILAAGPGLAQSNVPIFGPWAYESAPNSYCLQGRIWGYPGNCQFSSYAQCMATASGTDAGCGINPQYAFARQGRGDYHLDTERQPSAVAPMIEPRFPLLLHVNSRPHHVEGRGTISDRVDRDYGNGRSWVGSFRFPKGQPVGPLPD